MSDLVMKNAKAFVSALVMFAAMFGVKAPEAWEQGIAGIGWETIAATVIAYALTWLVPNKQ